LRVARARAQAADLNLPEFGDEQITLGLSQAWYGAASFKEAAERPLLPTFQAMLTPEQLAALDTLGRT
jgi:hypothetical protein